MNTGMTPLRAFRRGRQTCFELCKAQKGQTPLPFPHLRVAENALLLVPLPSRDLKDLNGVKWYFTG
jgi:hypothetical protein